MTPAPSQRIGVINALRGLAAVAVAWGHFVYGQGHYLSLSGKYGYLGVHVFFVISGFVIPWSLHRVHYVLRDYPHFLLKRNLRLYPPYLASIVITLLAVNFIMAPLLHLPRLAPSGRDLLLHATYLNDILGVPWINVVYWTLAIEFQWYLLVGLIFPLLATRNRPLRFLGITSLMAAFYLIPYYKFVFHSIPIFLIGVFVFQYRAQLISLLEMFGLIAVMAFAMWHPIGWIVAAVATFTGLIIALVTFELRALDRVGDVSYSLYLLHLPIGITLIGCLSRWLPYSGSYLGVLDALGLAVCGLAAWAMYQAIERPSQEMSSAIRLPHSMRRRAAQAAIAAAGGD